MNYRKFDYNKVNYHGTRERRSKRTGKQGSNKTVKALVVIFSLFVILFGAKLMLSPIVSAIASIVKESTATLSYLISHPELEEVNGVTNILLVGVDERFEGGTSLTDTIIILSYNHDTNSASMVSFPRDLWVRIPAFNNVGSYFTKINGVYTVGEEYGYSDENGGLGGGSGLLARVIQDHLDIPIQYYVRVNFDAFRNAIDAVGGVDIYVDEAFTDYQYPREGYENAPESSRYEVVSFDQGWQHMDGETALKYSRSRHAFGPEGSDFSRARRQQKVIMALKDKILSNDTLFNLSRIKNLYISLASEFDTNIQAAEVPAFYGLAKEQEDLTGIQTTVLSSGLDDPGSLLYVPNADDFGGAFVLLPRGGWSEVEDYVKGILYPSQP
ncbi:LCP family protein [candidate division WWE3 bacterium]|uniref:LCP family protein n=1 Tax=candidate division WWE3 bacterium TaxID=2053526 RepID=A0A955LKE9_UNCKA|nr:LCP family protein [candidate division WWE3 bacterium]